ncbi:lasso peptide biosynthesis B2 protein [Knoellia pratensis]
MFEERERVSLVARPPALLAVAIARALGRFPPRTIRRVLEGARMGARPATYDEAARARANIVAVSRRCAAQQCVQRSLATALLCRLHGVWPTWHTGVRMEPFLAHAWVSVDGVPVGEPESTALFRPIMTVSPTTSREPGEECA